MADTGAVTPEAIMQNVGADTFQTQAEAQAARDEWRELMQLLPVGMVPDAETLALAVDEGNTWTPLFHVRKRLIELGMANGGRGLIADPATVATLREQLRQRKG